MTHDDRALDATHVFQMPNTNYCAVCGMDAEAHKYQSNAALSRSTDTTAPQGQRERFPWKMHLVGPGKTLNVECRTNNDAQGEFYRAVAAFLNPYSGLGDYSRRAPTQEPTDES